MNFKLYTAVWCQPCQKLKAWLPQWLADRGHSLEVIDVDKMRDKTSIKGVPTLMFGQHVLTGAITPQQIKDALDD